jgi:TonB family protein
MKNWLFALLAVPGLLMAQDRQELRLDVAGEIGIDRQGEVYDYTINSILTPELKALVDKTVRQWKFEPVLRNGEPVYAKTGMRMILAALPVAAGYQMRIENLRFVGARKPESMEPPRYPREAMLRDVGGTVLVAVRVGADGKVLDAVAAQSQLYGKGGKTNSDGKLASMLEQASVDAAKRWKYQVADAAAGDAPETTLIVPIEYRVNQTVTSAGWREGASTAKPIPWLPSDKQHYDAAGLKQGESMAVDNGFKLKENVVGKTL